MTIGKIPVFGQELWKKFNKNIGEKVVNEIPVSGQELWNKLDENITPPATDVFEKLAEEIPPASPKKWSQGSIWAGN
jgi:hypothetical protein